VDIALIRARDSDRCARCGSSRELHVHHRVIRSQGGRDYAENLITLCAECHRWVHGHPYEARESGWLLRGTDNPGTIPVKHFAWPLGLVLLGHELDFVIWTDELAAEIEARSA
jgi:5-methylcytosine-specific restriction endonuclease McrA